MLPYFSLLITYFGWSVILENGFTGWPIMDVANMENSYWNSTVRAAFQKHGNFHKGIEISPCSRLHVKN